MNTIISKFKALFRRHDRDGLTVFGRSQHFDWEVLLTLFLLITIWVVLFSVQVYLGVKKGDIFTVEKKNDAPVGTISREKIDAALEAFKTRETELNELKANKPVFIDPSL